MALDMTFGRGDARFQYSDGEVESSVTINAADPEEVVLRKLRRLVALVEGETALEPLDRLRRLAQEEALAGAQKGFPAMPGPYKDAASGVQALVGNGWAAFSPPPVPDHLKDQVELIDPNEPLEGSE